MVEALAVAEESRRAGWVPIGAVVVDAASGEILGRGVNEGGQRGSFAAHAEMVAMERVSGGRLAGSVLVTTMEPCVMCLGAAMEAGISHVVYALSAPDNGGFSRVVDDRLPSFEAGVELALAFGQLEQWWHEVDSANPEGFVGRLLAANRPLLLSV